MFWIPFCLKDLGDSKISGIDVKKMNEADKELLIEKLAASLKKYIGKAKEFQK